MGSELKAIILSAWKIPCTFAWKSCPVYCLFFLSLSFQCRWSICSIHFNCLSSLVLVLKDVVVKEQHTSAPLYDLLFSTWSVFFWYTFVFVIAAKKKKCHNLWTYICICGINHTVLVFIFRLSHRGIFLQVLNLELFLCCQPFLTPEHKTQSPKLAAIYWN